MTKKEKEALSCMIKWFEETIDLTREDDVFKIDEDGAETHDAFVFENRIHHLRKVMKKSEEIGALTWEDV